MQRQTLKPFPEEPNTDTVPAMLTPGEFVIRKDAVDEIGIDKLNLMNNIDRLGQLSSLMEYRPSGYQEGGEVRGLEAAKEYKYDPSILDELLDRLPGIGGKRSYKRAQAYRGEVFFNPEDVKKREEQRQRAYKVLGTSGKAYQEDFDKETQDVYKSQLLGYAVENPSIFGLTTDVEKFDKSVIDSYLAGSDVGYYLTDKERKGKGRTKFSSMTVDPENITKTKTGRNILGIIPIGYEGSIKANPGINPFIDVKDLEKRIQESPGVIDGMFDVQKKQQGGEVMLKTNKENLPNPGLKALFDSGAQGKEALANMGYEQGGTVMDYYGGGMVKGYEGGGKVVSETLDVFGDKSSAADELNAVMALRAMRMQQGGMVPGMMPPQMPAQSLPPAGMMMQEGGMVDQPMPQSEMSDIDMSMMPDAERAYPSEPMEQMNLKPNEMMAYQEYGPDSFRYMAPKFKPRAEFTPYDAMVDAGIVDPYETSEDDFVVMTRDMANNLRGMNGV